MKNTQIVLEQRPSGVPTSDIFQIIESSLPTIQEGQILVKNNYLSLNPYMSQQMAGIFMGENISLGELCLGSTISTVIESKSDDFQPGDTVKLSGNWQSYCVTNASEARKIPTDLNIPPSAFLGPLGSTGLTAYAGVTRLLDVREGDVAVISAAAGTVGSVVAQICRIKGAHVIGLVGSEEKAALIKDKYCLDGAINYKTTDLNQALKDLCPNGVDLYWDNVGGDMLQTVMRRLAHGARVVLCGMMSQYGDKAPAAGIHPGLILKSRATVRGLVVFDHLDLQAEMEEQVAAWIQEGELSYTEDLATGIESAPKHFERLMLGHNVGKSIIRL